MFEEKLKESLGESSKGLKVLSAVYKKGADTLFVTLQYPNSVVLSQEEKESIKSAAKSAVGSLCASVKVSLKKAFVDLDYAAIRAKELLKSSYPLLSVFAENSLTAKEENEKLFFSFVVDNGLLDYVKDKQIKENLEIGLSSALGVGTKVSIGFDAIENECEQIEEDYFVPEVAEPRYIRVYNKQEFVGEKIEEKPLYISDVVSESERLCVCGAISYIQIKEFTTKSGKVRNLAKFGLKDPTGEIHAVMFLSEANKAKVEKLVAETEILVAGKCVSSKFSGGLELDVKDIMLCEIEKNFVEEVHYKTEAASYKVVFPEKLEHVEQISLFAPERKVSEYVANHDIVVFDIETTGLNFMDSEIIEIGAIKIKKGGVISEKFSTFVKPTSKIPKEITELTGITNEDVANGVNLSDALADFYKFTRGTTLAGHNVNFDYGFISYYGKKVGYDFSGNEKHDTYALSTKYVKGLRNYKLKTVAEHFGVSLKDAHRAYNDAYATAEVYLKLSELM